MNILFLTPRDSKTNLGGVERHVKLLTEELGRRGHEVKELSLSEADKGYKSYKNNNYFKDSPWHTPRRILFKLMAWGDLWRKRDLFRWAEVVHVHDVFWWVMPFIIITKITKFREKHEPKIFVTFHGWEGRWPPTRSAVWQKKLAAFLSDGTIGVGDFYQKWYGVKPDRVVWGVLDNSYKSYKDYKRRFNKGIYRKLEDFKGDKGKVFRLAFLGRLEEVNGIEIVIEAIAKIAKFSENRERDGSNRETPCHAARSHPIFARRILALFVGDGSWRKKAEKVGKVTGMVKNPWKYLAEAEAVIASSYLAILEAAAMGKRVIAVANNPLKRDYLEGYPMRRGFEIVGDADELLGLIRDKSYKSYKDYKERLPRPAVGGARNDETPGRGWDLEEARRWASGQTAAKLADEYEELWKLK